MTRECSTDFQNLSEYVNNYSLAHCIPDRNYKEKLKALHKCYFSILVWDAEVKSNVDLFKTIYPDCNDEILSRFSEVTSDLGASMFNWINGSYKTARVMLRVSVENFIRSISAYEDKSQLIEKNVYQLFSNAGMLNIFSKQSSPIINGSYNRLHSDYKILCEDVHTATINNMAHLTSLADFPSFEPVKANASSDIFIRVVKDMLIIFCMFFNKFFHSMHHKNKENIIYSIPRQVKPHVLIPNP